MNDVQKVPPAAVVFRHEAEKMTEQFKSALPAHIPVERFLRVVMTAVGNNPDLLRMDRRSLWNSAMKCAQDGLLPDGREAALVPYKGVVQYLPMVQGIRKKARNSGEIATWDVHSVYEHDAFDYQLGDEPYIHHKPTLGDRGKLIAVYSIAVLKSGERSRDVMSVSDVEKIRAKSMSAKGPWSDPTFYPEMAKKTVAKRHSKVLPMSSDLDDLIRRDDALYDTAAAGDTEAKRGRRTLSATLDALASNAPQEALAPPPDTIPADPETGEIQEDADDTTFPGDIPMSGDDAREQTPADRAYDRGYEAREKKQARRAIPGELRNDPSLVEAFTQGWDAADQDLRGASA